MGQNYLTTTVFDESIKRISFVFDECDDIILSMSGGKDSTCVVQHVWNALSDSTVLYELTKRVARERGRLAVAHRV